MFCAGLLCGSRLSRSDASGPARFSGPSRDWEASLQLIEQAGLRRSLTHADSPNSAAFSRDGQLLVNFSGNNYLDLAAHPRVINAAGQALRRWGAGAGASRLVSGSLAIHSDLENALAAFKGTESALVFSSGYMASLGLIQVLARRCDGSRVPILFDRLAHACLIDAARLSESPWRSFPHNDIGRVEEILKRSTLSPRAAYGDRLPEPTALVVTEGVFSMDGDTAPLLPLLELCERYGAVLVVDDAHGTGTVGPGGRGSVAHAGVPARSPHLVQLGTLSKALAAQGGFVAGPESLIRLLVNSARTFLFDTALAPASAAAALEALLVLQDEPAFVSRLQQNAFHLRRLLCLGETDPSTPVIPVIVGHPERAVAAAAALRNTGYLVGAIRPPTVPPGTSRLRLTVTAGHTPEQLAQFARALQATLASSATPDPAPTPTP